MANNINITVSKADMGLDLVDNTSDLNKPISTATQTALDTKVDKVTGSRLITSAESTLLGNTSGVNTGDQDLSGLVVKNADITGATKTKVTYDAKGLITSGADATTADIADSTNKRYVTDANLTTIGNQSGTNTGDETITTIKSKLGITTLSGSNTGDQDLSTYQVYATATTGSVISFVIPQIYNTPASPSTSNLTDSLTSSKIGVVQKIYHNKSVEPTYPAGWVKVGTGAYTVSVLNIIFVEWVSSTRCEYWITKPAS